MVSCGKNYIRPADPKLVFQEDADGLHLEHLVYWSGLIEEYYSKTGRYPLQNKLVSGSSKYDIGLVRIGTVNHQTYFTSDHDNYRPDLDNNANNSFQEFPVKTLIDELERGLGRTIDEKYSVYDEPNESVIWYPYFESETKGYLIWVPCLSCGVTTASTLTMDGKTPTVNIGSEVMIEGIPKAMTREDMMNHPDFKRWRSVQRHEEAKMREMEDRNLQDSK